MNITTDSIKEYYEALIETTNKDIDSGDPVLLISTLVAAVITNTSIIFNLSERMDELEKRVGLAAVTGPN